MKIAITGGIGSGKSYVCRLLEKKGIQVYDCDAAAKRLLANDPQLQTAVSRLVGPEVYVGGILQKPVLAEFLLGDSARRKALNAVVHPAVALDFLKSGNDWLESAIFFDSGFDQRVVIDKVICVSAPESLRVHRVMNRDGIDRDKAMEWIHSQLPQCEVERRSDFIIFNDEQTALIPQLDKLLVTLGIIP